MLFKNSSKEIIKHRDRCQSGFMNEYRRGVAYNHSLEMYAPKHFIMIAENKDGQSGYHGFGKYHDSQVVNGYGYPFHMNYPIAWDEGIRPLLMASTIGWQHFMREIGILDWPDTRFTNRPSGKFTRLIYDASGDFSDIGGKFKAKNAALQKPRLTLATSST